VERAIEAEFVPTESALGAAGDGATFSRSAPVSLPLQRSSRLAIPAHRACHSPQFFIRCLLPADLID
jgi:hypothetical protein